MLLLIVLTVLNASATELTILYWSDLHAHNLPRLLKDDGGTSELGGIARLAGLINEIRSGNPRTLVLNAGDDFTGTPLSSLTRGASQVEILNQVGLDGFVPGNHEFDHGWESLVEVMKKADFPVLLANVKEENSGESLFQGWRIARIDNINVGIIGLIYPGFKGSVIRSGVYNLAVSDPVLEAQQFVERNREHCHLLIALTHIGWEGDSALAVDVSGLDVIIGGHSHTPIDPPRQVNDVVIVQSGPHGEALGRLIVDVDTVMGGISNYRGELLPVKPGVAPLDQKVSKTVAKLEKKYTRQLDRRLGTLALDWVVDGHRASNAAQWAADAMLIMLQQKISNRLTLSVINNGNLRRGHPAGSITERDLWEICPFENQIVIFEITGPELIRIVEKQLQNPREYLTWSGLQVVAEDGLLKRVAVKGQTVTELDAFSVATTGYIWDQIDSYLGIKQGDRSTFFPPLAQREILIEAVELAKVISSRTDDRWTVR